jgi:hypothetical protein
LEDFRTALKHNIQIEKEKQRQKMELMKRKYDKEGVEIIDDVSEIGKDDPETQFKKQRKLMQMQMKMDSNEAE